MKFKEIEVVKIKAKDNVRTDIPKDSIEGLMQSIKEHGIIQPLLVKANNDQYDLIAGFRRLAAAKALKLENVPCVIEDIEEKDRKQVQLIENIQRENLNPVDEAVALSDLSKKHNVDDLAMMIGKTAKFVSDRISILSLPISITDALKARKISIGHAIVILRIPNPKGQVAMFKDILGDKMSIIQAESNLERFSKRLEYAPFDKKECKDCAHNGVHIKDLFDEDADLKGQCMNPECYDKKIKEHIKARIAYWKEKKISVMTKEQYYSGESNKWHTVQNYEMQEIGKDVFNEEMKKGENVAVTLDDTGREELLMKRSVWNALTRRKAAGGKVTGTDDALKKQREESRRNNRADETKRRFLIEKLEKNARSDQLDRIVLEILFNSEHGTEDTISEFFIENKCSKKKVANFEIRYKMADMLLYENLKNSAIVKEQIRVASRAIKNHDTDYLESMGKGIKVDMSQFRIDEEYLQKHTKDSLLKLVKEFKLKTPDKFDTKSKGDMIKWILEQKIDCAPKELVK